VLQLDLAHNEDVEVRVVDIRGNVVVAQSNQPLTCGTHLLPVDASALAAGNYFVVVTTGGVQRQLPLTVVR
jgi:hypothetical protein